MKRPRTVTTSHPISRCRLPSWENKLESTNRSRGEILELWEHRGLQNPFIGVAVSSRRTKRRPGLSLSVLTVLLAILSTRASAETVSSPVQQQRREAPPFNLRISEALGRASPTVQPSSTAERTHSPDRAPDLHLDPSGELFYGLPDDRRYDQKSTHRYRALQTEQYCPIAMAVRDSNRDDLLNQTEFVGVLNQLFSNQYADADFESLPCELQDTFTEYADSDTGAINVEGTKPGQTLTDAQSERITALCAQIVSVNSDNPTSGPCQADSPGTAPVAAPTDGSAGENLDCSGTIERSQCNTALAIGDLNRDIRLESSEYVRFINRLSSNAYVNADFSALPGNIQAVFEKFASDGYIDLTGTMSGQNPSDAQDLMLDSLCCEADLAVADPGQPVAAPTTAPSAPTSSGGGDSPDCSGTISQSSCNTALSVADSDRDSSLSDSEYVRFVNRLSSNAYNGMDFSDLPSSLQANFQKFATTNGQVDVNGSKPGQTPTSDQAEFLAAFCCETDLAVSNPDDGGSAPTQPPSPTQPSASSPPTYDPQFCRTMMASSDFDRDDRMSEDEYVRFLNRLTQNQYQGADFASLSQPLQDNFNNAAQDGTINIYGSKPGQSSTTAQSTFLDEFCVDTAAAVQEGGSSGTSAPRPTASPGSSPTAAPDGGGNQSSQPPTFADNLCRTSMASSDSNRDDYLDQDEYVRFLNRLTSDEFADATYDTLDPVLQQTYKDLVDDTGQINIFGSRPGDDGTEEQEAFLLKICLEVSMALNQPDGSPPPPTSPPSGGQPAPTSPASTFPPGFSEVYNSFIISNSGNLTAADLQSGPNREGLDQAYGLFAERSVDAAASTKRALFQLRGRRLEVTFVPDGYELYLLQDEDCPSGLNASDTCQVVFAKFQVKIDEEDAEKVSDTYSARTQQEIADGDLQAVLIEVDPRNRLRIVNASFPIRSTLPPTSAPSGSEPTDISPSPAGGGDNGKNSGSAAGGIVGGILGAIALCAFIGWASSKYAGKGGGKGVGDDEDGGRGDDDASDGDKDNGFGKDKDDSGRGSNDFGYEKPEQNPGDTKNVFGFGKKNKQGSDKDLNAFGLDTGNDNAFGDDNDNMELFAFDEPSVVKGGGDGQEGSVGGKDNGFGGDSGWGNNGNGPNSFFGSDGGWGAQNSNAGGADNFFGASTFDNGDKGDSGSRSGSGSAGESYTSSEDSTYQSEDVDEGGDGEEDVEEGSGSYSRSSAEGSSYESGSRSGRDDGAWDGMDEGGNSFETNGSSLEGSSKRSSRRDKGMTDSEGDDEDGSYSGSQSGSGSASASESGTTATTRTEDIEKREEYRAQVDALVRLVLPDEVDKVDAMMEQFKGREAELVSTLQTMQERSATQRARAAVHKSKSRPQRGEDGVFAMSSGIAGGAEGSTAGTAAIAAASLPIPAAGMFDDGKGAFGGGEGFGNEDAFGAPEAQQAYADDDGEEGSYYDDEEGSRSHSGSGSRSGSRSYYSGDEEERSVTEGSRSQGSRSYYSEEGSRSQYSGEGSQSHYSGEGSRSHYSGEGSRSHYSGEEGSQGSRSRGSRSDYGDEEGSRSQSHTGSRSRSQYSGDEGGGSRSQRSGDGSRSYYSGEEGSRGSQSYDSREEGSRSQGSRSYDSRAEGSQGSRSYYSGEEGEEGEERSYYSGEEDDEGSYSDEGEE